MKSKYRIEDILHQSGQQVVYRVTDASGQNFALTRLIFGEAELGGLEDGVFEKAFEALKQFDHPCLRKVLDAGQDEVDRAPWIVTEWWDAPSVLQRYEDGNFKHEDKVRLEGQVRSLMEALGGFAATIKFDISQVVGIEAQDGSKVETFTLDLGEWFLVYARTGDAHFDRNPELGLARLLGKLPVSAPLVSAADAGPPSTYSPQHQVVVPTGGGFSIVIVATVILLAAAVGGGVWFANQAKDPEAKIALREGAEEEQPEAALPVEKAAAVAVKPVPKSDPNSFVVSDEGKIKTMKGKTVTLTGKILKFEHSSERIYLHWKDLKKHPKKVFAAKLFTKDLTKTQDMKFFENVVGKTVKVKGEVARSGSGRGWYVVFSPGEDFEVIEESKPVAQVENEGALKVTAQRPPAGEMAEVVASDSTTMKANVGKWVKLTGHVARLRRNGGWLFDEETADGEIITGSLKVGDMSKAVEFKVTVTGFLTEENEVVVESLEDVLIHREAATLTEGRVYKLDEEALIRKMSGKHIRLKARVLKLHETSRTLALIFTEDKPEMVALIYTSKLDAGAVKKKFEGLIGKEVVVSGKLEGVRSATRGFFQLTLKNLQDIQE